VRVTADRAQVLSHVSRALLRILADRVVLTDALPVGLAPIGAFPAHDRGRVPVGRPVAALIIMRGSVWTVNHYFWIDLAVILAMVFLIMSVAIGVVAPLRRVLDTRHMKSGG
jgi:hypothetical protein